MTMASNGAAEKRRQTWIFQANPDRYRIDDSLRIEYQEHWNLNQHAAKVEVGDRVLIWISGREAGIYAVGKVVTPPVVMPDSPQGQGYWIDSAEGLKPKPRVLVRYSHLLLSNPLLKSYLETDPVLQDMRIITFPRGTNFPVSDEQWKALEPWLRDGGVSGSI